MSKKPVSIRNPDLGVLIVDDNVEYVQVLKRIMLKSLGYKTVVCVDSCEQGQDLLLKQPGVYSLLFVDQHFPGKVTGSKWLDELRQLGQLEDKVVFLITSDPSADNLKRARAAGAIGLVAKPFNLADLEKQLEKAERSLQQGVQESF